MASVKITPWSLHEQKKPEVVFRDQLAQRPEPVDAPVRMARRVYIKPADIDKYGFTSGCPKCEHEMRYGRGRCTVPHSERCRVRIMDELIKTPEGKIRIERATMRMDQATAEVGQRDYGAGPLTAQGEELEQAAASGVRAQDGPVAESRNPFEIGVDVPVGSHDALPEPTVNIESSEAPLTVPEELPHDGVDGVEAQSGGMDLDVVQWSVGS